MLRFSKLILFNLGVEAILLDELGNPALYLGPCLLYTSDAADD